MRIAYIVLEDFPGSETRVQRQARAMSAGGHAVRIFACSGPSVAPDFEGIPIVRSRTRREKAGGPFRRIREYLGYCAEAALWTLRLSATWRPDVVHVANMPDWLVLSALPARWFAKSRLVLDLHDPMPELWEAKGGGAALCAGLRRLEGLSIRVADMTLVATSPMKRALEARHAGVTCHVVMNAVDESRFPPREPRLGWNEPLVIGYHGTLAERFGVETVLAALAGLQRRRAVVMRVIGDGDGRRALEQHATGLGIGDRVEFLGQRDASALSRLIQGFDVGVVPYADSAFMRLAYSTKSVEYAVSGVPMIVADLPSMRELFCDTEVLFAAPGSVEAWSSALECAMADPGSTFARACAAARRVREYSWSRRAHAYVGLIESLLLERTGSSVTPARPVAEAEERCSQ